MADSPYEPPRTILAPAVPPRPAPVRRALWLIWADYALYGVACLWSPAAAREEVSFSEQLPSLAETDFYTMVGLGLGAVLLALLCFLNLALGQGRGWARVAYVGITSITIVVELLSPFRRTPDDAASVAQLLLSLLGLALEAGAIWLLLTPRANDWFRALKARP